jgi:hypothetical protein
MGKLVLRKTILRNMIDRVWAALVLCSNSSATQKKNINIPRALQTREG